MDKSTCKADEKQNKGAEEIKRSIAWVNIEVSLVKNNFQKMPTV
jgi:hypothetical protein